MCKLPFRQWRNCTHSNIFEGRSSEKKGISQISRQWGSCLRVLESTGNFKAAFKDDRSCGVRTFLDRSSISKILHHNSFLLVNWGFAMPMKLYSNFKKCDKIDNFSLWMCKQSCLLEFLFFHAGCIGSYFVFNGPTRASPFYEIRNLRSLCVSEGCLHKLSVVYIYFFFNGQFIIHMILYFVCKVIQWIF